MERNEELFLIKSIAEMLNKETDMDSMLQQVLNRILALTSLHTGWIFLFDEKGEFELKAYAQLPEALEFEDRKYLCEGGCRCIDRCLSGRLNKATNIIDCERIEYAMKEKRGDTEGITHHASVPIKSGEELYGLLNVASPNKLNFNDDELHILESISYQIGTACERMRLSEKQHEMHILEERNRLARDLHDSVNQHLFSIMYTAKGTKSITTDEDVGESLDEIYQLSKEALSEMKNLIWQLRSDNIKEGLKKRIENYGKKLKLSVTSIFWEEDIPGCVESTFWKITQEALNNVYKHANASQVIIEVKKVDSYMTLTISDNGCGFNRQEVSQNGFGLTSMAERAKLVEGDCKITSELNKGTTVYVQIPLRKGRRGSNVTANKIDDC
ncbi:two-component system NarL family sensor kinase [Evansella vedderi]|uniref:histidine kinase n=1 Tax=Evansella vedderi TaxID=38282 RepID=A0ABT9ZVB7_9BACI|nr:GAF domain-containing sensor histidine kinase [Evansella vedderi]MDQ0255178.1 two-component system NarL family sensor kinase [Evansella vedderi]